MEKYLQGSTQFVVPAELDGPRLEMMRYYARKAWSALDCYGMARIDFLVGEDAVYLNEINTVPGFTSISMYPRLLAESGITNIDLMRRLITDAQQRETARSKQREFHTGKDWYKEES